VVVPHRKTRVQTVIKGVWRCLRKTKPSDLCTAFHDAPFHTASYIDIL
jgi:uroporphyrinogen-III decarboxylase